MKSPFLNQYEMKSLSKKIALLLVVVGCMTACKKEDHELGTVLDPSEISFEVTQDLSVDPGGNTVILRNETPGTVSIWDYGTGRSNRMVDTVQYAFQGTYVIHFSVLTAGGVVDMDPVTVEVTEDNLEYVQDPLWIALSGGPGNEKSWVLDMEAKYFDGPIYFYDPNDFSTLWWAPSPSDVASNNVMPVGDYGAMTFSLQGGPFFHADKPMEGDVEEEGTYYLDVAASQLTINGATILRGYKENNKGLKGISNWSEYEVLTLNEDAMQLGVYRDKDVDGEGPALLVYNFISKEYSDNWVPSGPEPPDEGFDPDFGPGELLDMLTGGPSSGRLWKLDATGNPVDWLAAGIGWTESHESSRDWGWNDSWDAVAEDSWIRFDRYGGLNYTLNQDGEMTSGSFSINEETNEIMLNGNTLIQNPDSWMNPTQNTIKVVKAFPGEELEKGIWFGTSYDAEKDEWFAFHYVLPSE